MGAAIANFFSLEDEYEKLQKNLKENIPKKINGEASEKIQEYNNEEKEISEENNGIQSGISDNNIISADKEIKDDKISSEQNTCMISADKKEEEREKEDEVNKTEENIKQRKRILVKLMILMILFFLYLRFKSRKNLKIQNMILFQH